jgi:hypothetical protein
LKQSAVREASIRKEWIDAFNEGVTDEVASVADVEERPRGRNNPTMIRRTAADLGLTEAEGRAIWKKALWCFNHPKPYNFGPNMVEDLFAIGCYGASKALPEFTRMDEEGHNSALGFCNRSGGFLPRGNFRLTCFRPLVKRAGVPMIRLHDLCHSCATLLLGAGVHAKIVSERLGHGRIAVTRDMYSHVLPTMQREAASKFDKFLSGTGEKGGTKGLGGKERNCLSAFI